MSVLIKLRFPRESTNLQNKIKWAEGTQGKKWQRIEERERARSDLRTEWPAETSQHAARSQIWHYWLPLLTGDALPWLPLSSSLPPRPLSHVVLSPDPSLVTSSPVALCMRHCVRNRERGKGWHKENMGRGMWRRGGKMEWEIDECKYEWGCQILNCGNEEGLRKIETERERERGGGKRDYRRYRGAIWQRYNYTNMICK